MKYRSSIVTTAIGTAIALTLGGATLAHAKEEKKPAGSAANVRQEAAEVIEAISQYVETQREALETRTQKFVDRVNTEVEQAGKQMKEVPAESRAALQRAIHRAEAAKKKADKELADIRDATGEKWESAKKRLTAALEEVEEARQEVSDALKSKS